MVTVKQTLCDCTCWRQTLLNIAVLVYWSPLDFDANQWRKWATGQGHETINLGGGQDSELKVTRGQRYSLDFLGRLSKASLSTPFESGSFFNKQTVQQQLLLRQVGAICSLLLSFVGSVCEQNNSQTRLRISTMIGIGNRGGSSIFWRRGGVQMRCEAKCRRRRYRDAKRVEMERNGKGVSPSQPTRGSGRASY